MVRLDPELSELVAGVGTPLIDATLLTRWWSARYPRAAWQLRFADRRVLKGVRFNSPAVADRVEHLLGPLGDRHFPRVVARRGPAMLLQWIEGAALDSGVRQANVLRRCGFLHGWIHVQAPAEAAAPAPGSEPDWGARLEGAAETLLTSETLAWPELGELMDQARMHLPCTAARGITHGDFCAENLIVQPSDGIYVVDNETLQVDALEYDLARTWYRWPMGPDQWAAYGEGYSEHRGLTDFKAHFPYWSVLVLLEAAVWHVSKETGAASIPLRRLLALRAGAPGL
jgi:Ser/Thr protein kinase RdoA (MazF antagonist)